jgi:hypothetical protein
MLGTGAAFVGDERLLRQDTCAILNSRQSKRPSRRDAWVDATVAAAESLVASGKVLLTSTGMNTWELLLYLANELGGKQIIVVPAQPGPSPQDLAADLSREFKLDANRFGLLVFAARESAGSGRKLYWQQRDRLIIDLANVIIPIAVRPGGSLDQLLAAAGDSGKDIERAFAVRHHPGADRVSYRFAHETINPQIARVDWDYVTHWTRSSHSPYPGETRCRYYRDLLAADHYPRSAADTLTRIITERKVRASSRFIRGGYRVVSFTSLTPVESLRLMRWRRRYVYYNFEPYGLAVKADTARRLGIRPVIYGDDNLYQHLPDPDKPFFQHEGTANADWRPEAELRHLDDFSLAHLPEASIKVVVYSSADMIKLTAVCPYQVVPLVLP